MLTPRFRSCRKRVPGRVHCFQTTARKPSPNPFVKMSDWWASRRSRSTLATRADMWLVPSPSGAGSHHAPVGSAPGPEIETGLLLAPELPRWMRSTLTRLYSRADALHPETVMVDAAYMQRAHRAGLPVRPWTANEPDEMRRLIALGVDTIITDVPEVLFNLVTGVMTPP